MDERLQFVARRLAGEAMAELCREFGVSRKTGYKILYTKRSSSDLCIQTYQTLATHNVLRSESYS
jgi:transposase-like protein